MLVRTGFGRDVHLGYCTNVHPGEGLAALHDLLRRDVAPVARVVAPALPFGLGLRLGNAAALALSTDADALARLRALMDELGMYVFTVNAFPYGDFAADSVKDLVYQPDWRDEERRLYTMRVAEAIVSLPGPGHRTISTVAGGFKPQSTGGLDNAERAREMSRELVKTAEALARLSDRTGVHVRLCLEPEPFTTLETTDEVLDFFTRHVFPAGEATREHLGLCYDCCHQAVEFEDAPRALRALSDAGIPIGKVQISSALHLSSPGIQAHRDALLAFAEPRYLHQTCARLPDGRVLRALDLPLLEQPSPEWLSAEAWRCHFHVPIGLTGEGCLESTRADWEAAVETLAAAGSCDHFEVETYSFHVMPEATRARFGSVSESIIEELRTAREVLCRSTTA
ncbi:MAG: hypothetical protein EXR76_02250 [Myxococcales bacterium]|nr:hypothetical protein [Myxococcales bacterium]